jgi:hypothetical protein
MTHFRALYLSFSLELSGGSHSKDDNAIPEQDKE